MRTSIWGRFELKNGFTAERVDFTGAVFTVHAARVYTDCADLDDLQKILDALTVNIFAGDECKIGAKVSWLPAEGYQGGKKQFKPFEVNPNAPLFIDLLHTDAPSDKLRGRRRVEREVPASDGSTVTVSVPAPDPPVFKPLEGLSKPCLLFVILDCEVPEPPPVEPGSIAFSDPPLYEKDLTLRGADPEPSAGLTE